MHVVFALMMDHEIHNEMRRLAIEVDRKYGVGLRAALLPPHVTLKQSIEVSDLAALETFFRKFAASVPPFEARVTNLEVVGSRVLWIDVEETPLLRNLHRRLNTELAAHFPNTAATFDGPEYHFHATVALSAEPSPIFQQIAAEYDGMIIDLTWTVKRMVLFLQERTPIPTTLSYLIMPIGRDSP